MFIKTLRFVSLLCAALVMGLTITHDLEIPGKHQLSGAEWLMIQNTFYGGFALVGGVGETLGLIVTVVLCYLLRGQRIAFVLTLIAALSFAATLALFAFGNQPINLQVSSWTPQNLPTNWPEARDAWDGFHAASSAFAALAFITLLIALLRDTPSRLKTGKQ